MMEDVTLYLIMVAEIQIKYLFLKRAQIVFAAAFENVFI